jgi:hypothetical protein
MVEGPPDLSRAFMVFEMESPSARTEGLSTANYRISQRRPTGVGVTGTGGCVTVVVVVGLTTVVDVDDVVLVGTVVPVICASSFFTASANP